MRAHDAPREVSVQLDFTPNALASVLYRQGDTMVLACCTVASRLPGWFPRDATKGWVNAEYQLLPGSTDSRVGRERRGAKGRTYEIERLIARALRGVVDLEALGPLALTVDCDVLNADGGTRCASITAAYLALRLGVRRLIAQQRCLPADLRPTAEEERNGTWVEPHLSEEAAAAHEDAVFASGLAAVSVGLIGDEVVLDLDKDLDNAADVDMNVVMTHDGRFVEVQGTGEETMFSREQLDALLDRAAGGIRQLIATQDEVLSDAR